MKRYRDNPLLIVLNIILEFILMMAAYALAGMIRIHMPETIGKAFAMQTAIAYAPFACVMSLVMVVIYLLLGDYYSIHFKSKLGIVVKCFGVSLITGVLCACGLFLIDGSRFSRLLLLELVILWTVFITVKRCILDVLGYKIWGDKVKKYNVIFIGDGKAACRYYKGLIEDTKAGNHFSGYLAATENGSLPSYLGGYDKIYETVASTDAGLVIIDESQINAEQLRTAVTVCGMFGREAMVIPAFQEYILENQRVKKDYGVRLMNVNAVNTSDILGVNIAVTNMEETVGKISDNLDEWRGQYICVSNVHTTVMAHDDSSYRDIQNGAAMSLPDGGPLSSYSRKEGKTEAERVTGPDLMRQMLVRSGEHHWRHFFYGSSQKTLDMLKEKIQSAYPGAEIAGMISPPYREITQQEDEEYVRRINESNPDFLWVGLGAPKQEIWMAAHKGKINALMIGVGAAFDYESGNLKRAPMWMQRCSLEWFYRFMQEPKRLFKRYFVTNIKYMWLTRR